MIKYKILEKGARKKKKWRKRTNEKQAYVKNIIEKKKKLETKGENNISKDGILCVLGKRYAI